jgi:hypothetical protein
VHATDFLPDFDNYHAVDARDDRPKRVVEYSPNAVGRLDRGMSEISCCLE